MTKNKIYVIEKHVSHSFGDINFCILVAASDETVAKKYVEKQIGLNGNPVAIIGAEFPILYNQTGEKELEVQARILYNSKTWFKTF